MRELLHPYLCKLFISADLKRHCVKAHSRPAAWLCSKSISLLIPFCFFFLCVWQQECRNGARTTRDVKMVHKSDLLEQLTHAVRLWSDAASERVHFFLVVCQKHKKILCHLFSYDAEALSTQAACCASSVTSFVLLMLQHRRNKLKAGCGKTH